EHLDGVAIVDPHIAQAVVQQAVEQGPDTRAVHLDTDEILLRRRLGHLQQGMAHAETDFQSARRLPAKDRIQIQLPLLQAQAETRPALFPAALLAFGHATGAHHEAADGAARLAVGGLLRILVDVTHFRQRYLPAARRRRHTGGAAFVRPGRLRGRQSPHASWLRPSVPASGRRRWRCSSAPRRSPAPWRWWHRKRYRPRRQPEPARWPLPG